MLQNRLHIFCWPFYCLTSFSRGLALVVQTSGSAIHRINIYPVDSAISFPNTYLLDSDLSGG